MKIILYLVTFISLTIQGFSQYNPFISENKQWVEAYNNKDLTDFRPGESKLYFVFFKGDTVINNSKYHKLYKQQFFIDTWYTSNASHLIDSTLMEPVFYSFLREDTINKEVYSLHYFPEERLLYDFTLDIGDSLTNDAGTFYLDSIVDITLENNSTRKKFCFSNPIHQLTGYYIEGIGGENGILEPFYGIGLSGFQSSGGVICYSEDSVELYGTCNYPDYVITGINEKTDNPSKVKLFPNPSNGQTKIDLGAEYSRTAIKILDLRGAVLKEETYRDTQICNIDLNFLKSGYYLISVSLDNEKNIILRMVKE